MRLGGRRCALPNFQQWSEHSVFWRGNVRAIFHVVFGQRSGSNNFFLIRSIFASLPHESVSIHVNNFFLILLLIFFDPLGIFFFDPLINFFWSPTPSRVSRLNVFVSLRVHRSLTCHSGRTIWCLNQWVSFCQNNFHAFSFHGTPIRGPGLSILRDWDGSCAKKGSGCECCFDSRSRKKPTLGMTWRCFFCAVSSIRWERELVRFYAANGIGMFFHFLLGFLCRCQIIEDGRHARVERRGPKWFHVDPSAGWWTKRWPNQVH